MIGCGGCRWACRKGGSMTEKSSWETFSDAHAPIYEENVFTKNTLREVDSLPEELLPPPGGSILNVGCGTRRPAIERLGLSFSVGL